MKIASLTLTLITALAIQTAAMAQQVSDDTIQLVAGEAGQQGAVYRFSNFFSGTDAEITVDRLVNLTLDDINGTSNLDLQQTNPDAIENASWTPVFAGTGGEGLHYADFTVRFFANGTNTPKALESFTTSFFGSDLSDTSGGFMMEFVHVTGASSLLSGADLAAAINGGETGLAVWNYEDTSEFTIRYAWQGDNGPAEGKTFDTLIGNYSTNASSNISSQYLSLTAVPEPSTAFLFVLSVFPLALRRKRAEKI